MSERADALGVVEKLRTGIPGFDSIAAGGVPQGRTTLVSGTAGSAKTVFAAQFLVAGVRAGQPGVFVTFEETPACIRRNMRGFGWDIARFEGEGTWAFVDGSPDPRVDEVETGSYEFGGLMARIEHAR